MKDVPRMKNESWHIHSSHILHTFFTHWHIHSSKNVCVIYIFSTHTFFTYSQHKWRVCEEYVENMWTMYVSCNNTCHDSFKCARIRPWMLSLIHTCHDTSICGANVLRQTDVDVVCPCSLSLKYIFTLTHKLYSYLWRKWMCHGTYEWATAFMDECHDPFICAWWPVLRQVHVSFISVRMSHCT